MKKLYLIIILLTFTTYLFSQDTLIGWTFPTASLSDSVANKGLVVNRTKVIRLQSDSAIKYITKTYASPPACAQAMGLSNGTAQQKGWYINLDASGYRNLKLFSKQNACMTHSGPKYFKIQFKTGTGNWTDLPGGAVTTGFNWTTGTKANLALPAACNNTAAVHIRWVMVSDSNVAGATNGTLIVADSSMSRIDDIFILGDKILAGNDTIVGWNFPTATKADTLASHGIMVNRNEVIRLKSDSAIMFITKTYASPPASAQAMGLSDGTAQERGWYIKFNSQNYRNLKVYSKQNTCMTHSGPKYYKIQYKLPTTSWTDIPGGNITTGFNWTKAVLTALPLPAACDNQPFVHLRWVMVSDSNLPGATNGTLIVTDSSMSRIDDIFVIGEFHTGIQEVAISEVSVYPNPAGTDGLTVQSSFPFNRIDIYNAAGQMIYTEQFTHFIYEKQLKLTEKGIYMINLSGNDKQGNVRLLVR